MKIISSNSITLSNVNDGTITHTAYSYSADGTDRFTTVYPNLNLLNNSSAKTKAGFFKDFDKVEDGYGELTRKGNNSYAGISMWDSFSIQPGDYKPGDTYTMSMDVMFTSWNFPAGVYLGEFWIGQRYTHNSDWSINSWKRICFIDLPKDPSKMMNQWIRITNTSTIPPHEDPSVHTESIFLTKFSGSGEASFTLRIRNPKQEPGSVATPHMPSASEVTTADWPKYIGQYTDFMQADSTNPSDYTWGLVRGNDGISPTVKINPDTSLTIVDAKGTITTPVLKGTDGIAGKEGVGVKTTVITYAISTSGTTAPTTGWTSSVPSLVKGQYLWTKMVWTYTDNSSETGYSVTYISKDGNNGTNGVAGKDGVGISNTTIEYVGAVSGTSKPTSGWTATVPTVAAGSYLWTKTVWAYTDNTSETGYSVAMMGVKGDKGDPGIKGNDGTDGTSGIIVSSVAPASPQNGQLWQDTSTTPQLVKKWTGSEWVIWELYVQNLKADTLSVLTPILGDVTAGTVKLMDNIDVNGTLKKYGIYQSKFGLLSSGPTLATPSAMSNSQMGVANLNKGELRFIVNNYTEDLKNVQETGMSDTNTAFINFNSYDNGKDVMLIGSSGDIVFKGITSQDTPWIAMGNGAYYKNMFSRVYISYSVKATSTADIPLGVLPVGLRPFRGLHLTANAWAATLVNDRHIEVRTTGEVTLYNPANGASYDGEVSFTI